ncbi:hypothetical protein JZ751_004707 [Albula glossodonta]|uniref:Fucolectin tachylectin-4 pentraxin-1 domain-containing protein n=1 Tax=Albula glossodonta TaxID=121402 RepID=A0A8T2MMP2_9TELE|nr:hypothetical protein JZ751_004707 [Albula glossodonta]
MLSPSDPPVYTCYLTDRMKLLKVILLSQILAVSMANPLAAPNYPGFKLVNVALQGKATQSVLFHHGNSPHYSAFSQPDHAIDGNRDSHWHHGSCTHTANVPNPWWRVDLLKPYKIVSVTITNRQDCCAERINGAQIRIGNSLENNGIDNPVCSVIGSWGSGATQTFTCPEPMVGRYVTVYIPRAEYLHLCEVEVNALFPDFEEC